MTHTKIYAEEYVLKQDREIQTSLRASDILKTKAPIPDGFIKLEVGKGNYSRTTNPEWTKILSERYDFSYQDGKKWITIDIPHFVMERLGLEKETDITCKVYIDPKVLKKQADCGGTTVELKEIHIEKSLAEEEEEKNKSKGERIIGLERKLDEQLLEIERLSKILGTLKGKDRIVEECESIINEKETEIREKDRRIAEIGEVLSNLQNQFNSLQNERNEIQQVANNLENELHRFQGGLLGSLFRNFKKSTEKIKDLKARIVRTGAELFDKDRRIENLNNQIHQLTTQRDNLQTQVNNLNITVGERDRTITGLNNQISSLKGQINSIQNNYDYYYRQYHDKDRKVDNLHSKISSLQNEISILKNKSIDNYQVKSVNIFKSLRVPFRHTTHQIDSCEFYTTKESSVRPSIKHLKSLSRFAFPDDENRAFFQLWTKEAKVIVLDESNGKNDTCGKEIDI